MVIEKAQYTVECALNEAEDGADGPTKYPGMTYEQGASKALMWILGEISDEEFEFSGARK